ncbi:MAG: GNAT family N-acetyltransferase [Planctomycetota bacterium]|nr:GNAT family N-acetyltransferase [Planctomycetota bacterium]
MNPSRLTTADIELCQVTAPLSPEATWEIESLLLKIFEYGDYSFRSALSGEYSKTLNCTFFLAKYRGEIVGAAGCLYAHKNPAIAIVGPVGVAAEYRGIGIGKKLMLSLIRHLKLENCMAGYLGVSPTNSTASFFSSLGFEKYKGIVMRLLLCPQAQFEQNYFGKSADTKIRRAAWGDFPGIQGLVSFPCLMYTIDLQRSIFSSKYVEPARFLSVFPEMMRAFARQGGFANVLVAQHKENVVGLAQIRKLPGQAQRHIGELDFYVHDNFVEKAESLVRATLQESTLLSVQIVNFYCLGCDRIKRDVIEALGGIHIATLPENILLYGKYEDVLVYQLKGKT